MFKASKQTAAGAYAQPRRKLTRAQRREIDAAIRRAARTDKKELSAQDSIPYQRIWPDGVCRVTDTFYTKTVQFQDINYQLSQNEDKAAIFEGWSDCLNYDEYHYDLGEIGHDPYVLISLLTAYHQGAWTLDQVQPTLEMLFDRQYVLTETVEVETRYRTETRTDSEDNSYTVQVPYDYYICYVTLEVTDLSHLPVYLLDEDRLSMYATYMATLGNRPDLFPQDQYPGASVVEDYLDYDVPPEALEDEQLAAMLAEAEKYLGFPYVWGGSSPSTSFDCSGFVSWVINHSGWDVGRLGAQSLFNLCTPVSAANAKPGDLVFFTGTYDSGTPVSHCGIYVGGGMMIHCGSPISYANLSSSYWQEHLYSYARLP